MCQTSLLLYVAVIHIVCLVHLQEEDKAFRMAITAIYPETNSNLEVPSFRTSRTALRTCQGPETSDEFYSRGMRGIPNGLAPEKVKTWRNGGQGNSWEYWIG